MIINSHIFSPAFNELVLNAGVNFQKAIPGKDFKLSFQLASAIINSRNQMKLPITSIQLLSASVIPSTK